MRKSCLFILLILAFAAVSAQDKRVVKEHKISQRIETVINYEDGLNVKRVLEEQYFDEEGRLIEYKDWTKDVKLKKWIKYSYNEAGEIATEETLNQKGKIQEKVVYTYLKGLKVKKSYYDSKERLVKEKFYDYQYYK